MEWFASNQGVINTALIYVVLGISLQLPLRAGIFSFAAVGFYTFGAFFTGVVAKAGWNPWLALFLAITTSAALGMGLSAVLSKLKALYLAMATLAFIFIVKLVAESLEVTGATVGLLGVPLTARTPHLFGVAVICVMGMHLIRDGRTARIIEAMRIDDTLAEAVGISVLKQRHVIFVVSSAIGGLAGGLYALTITVVIPEQLGFSMVLTALSILVIGGVRHWAGAVIGAVIVAWLPSWLAIFGAWRPAVHGLVIVALAVFASNGVIAFVAPILKRLAGSRPRTMDESDGAAPEREVART